MSTYRDCPDTGDEQEVDVEFQRTGRNVGIERWQCPCGETHEQEVGPE